MTRIDSATFEPGRTLFYDEARRKNSTMISFIWNDFKGIQQAIKDGVGYDFEAHRFDEKFPKNNPSDREKIVRDCFCNSDNGVISEIAKKYFASDADMVEVKKYLYFKAGIQNKGETIQEFIEKGCQEIKEKKNLSTEDFREKWSNSIDGKGKIIPKYSKEYGDCGGFLHFVDRFDPKHRRGPKSPRDKEMHWLNEEIKSPELAEKRKIIRADVARRKEENREAFIKKAVEERKNMEERKKK